MLWPLLYVAIGLTLLMLALHLAAMRNEILRRRVRTLGLIAASTESRGPSA
jgi:heme exporter protein C